MNSKAVQLSHVSLRSEGFADELEICIKHTGWFCAIHELDSIRGEVFRLPGKRGFVAGYTNTMAEIIEYMQEIYPSVRAAALQADALAKHDAGLQFDASILDDNIYQLIDQSSRFLRRAKELVTLIRAKVFVVESLLELRQLRRLHTTCMQQLRALRLEEKGLYGEN